MSHLRGERARRSVAYYRIGWGLMQAAAALLIFLGRSLVNRADPHGALRVWLQAMIAENPIIDQVRESSIHVLGVPFRILDAAWVLLLLGVLNMAFGWLLLRVPRRARWIGMVVFGVGFLVGVGSILLRPTPIRVGLTALDLLFFAYFCWILPRALLLGEPYALLPLAVDKAVKDA